LSQVGSSSPSDEEKTRDAIERASAHWFEVAQ